MLRYAEAIGIGILATTSLSAAALQPEQVLVVANALSEDSVALASFYARQRGIPQENIVQVKTTTGYQISSYDYELRIRDPLRRFLSEHEMAEKIHCVVLMYGMPVRIARAVAADQKHLLKTYRMASTRTHNRLAINYELLGTVGRKFPPPGTRLLKPIGKLFKADIAEPSRPLPPVQQLIGNIAALLELKQKQLAGMMNPSHRQIAERQLLALHLELYGLSGLISYVKANAPQGAPQIGQLRDQLAEAQRELTRIDREPTTVETLQTKLKLTEQIDGVTVLCTNLLEKLNDIHPSQSQASLDSELALLLWDNYPLTGWKINPLHWRIDLRKRLALGPKVLMTARIDGPSKADAMRIIKSSMAAEKTGLAGTFYIDGGGGIKVKAVAYEANLRKLHDFLKRHTKLKVVYDQELQVFAKNTCPDAALYVGWYRLRSYVPAFTWNPGAVGWHIASYEAEDLRNPNSTRWCVKMIQNGVAATIGAVDEPTLGAFPVPGEFFALLLAGKWTVAECYWRTTPMVSWRMTLIADPLYNPFAAKPQISTDALPKGLAP